MRTGEIANFGEHTTHRRTLEIGQINAHLRQIARLHYRYRFDPDGIGADERQALRARVEAWLAAPGTGRG